MSTEFEKAIIEGQQRILERLGSIETSIGTFNDRFIALEKQIGDQGLKILEVETSANFISNAYELQKKEIELLKTELESQKEALKTVKKSLDNNCNDIKQERINRNSQDQYFRTSFFAKVCGIAMQEGEKRARQSTLPTRRLWK